MLQSNNSSNINNQGHNMVSNHFKETMMEFFILDLDHRNLIQINILQVVSFRNLKQVINNLNSIQISLQSLIHNLLQDFQVTIRDNNKVINQEDIPTNLLKVFHHNNFHQGEEVI